METFADRLNKALQLRNMTASELSKRSGVNEGAISQYRAGAYKASQSNLDKLSKILNVQIPWLMGCDVPMQIQTNQYDYNINLVAPQITDDVVTFPVMGDVSAGFDKIAIEDWTGDKIDVPPQYLKGRNKDDFFVLRVKGDSMYPEYKDGDKVLILKQNAVDYSGQVAVAIYNDDMGTIKKVEYRPNCVNLVPINPQYQPEEVKDVDTLHILGIPKLLVREIED